MDLSLRQGLKDATILLIDDDEDNLFLMSRLLRNSGCDNVHWATDPQVAVALSRQISPDLVLLDYRIPPTNGLDLLETLWHGLSPSERFPVVMLTAAAPAAVRARAFELGISDFLSKDFDPTELLIRVRNVLNSRRLYQETVRQRNSLEATVRLRTQELLDARREVLERLAIAAEYRDDQTGTHSRRVGTISARLAAAIGCRETYVEAIASAALLHDLGKIGIPDQILLKPARLSPPEMAIIRTHPVIGSQILAGCTEPVLAMAREIALTHHERWDGSGYPYGLRGEAIPLCGRIVAIADAFDAMISVRPFKAALPVEYALEEIQRCAGSHFDPLISEAFAHLSHTEVA